MTLLALNQSSTQCFWLGEESTRLAIRENRRMFKQHSPMIRVPQFGLEAS